MKVRELEARYPYMFEGPHIGLVHYRGWFPICASLCAAVDAALGEDKRRFHWTRIDRDGFWSARFEFAIDSPQVPLSNGADVLLDPDADLTWHFVYALVERAKEVASRACIACGAAANGVLINGTLWKSCARHRPPADATLEHVEVFLHHLRLHWFAD